MACWWCATWDYRECCLRCVQSFPCQNISEPFPRLPVSIFRLERNLVFNLSQDGFSQFRCDCGVCQKFDNKRGPCWIPPWIYYFRWRSPRYVIAMSYYEIRPNNSKAVKFALFVYCFSLRKKSSQVLVLWQDHRNDLFINGFGKWLIKEGLINRISGRYSHVDWREQV